MAARAAASQSFSGADVMGNFHHRMIDIVHCAFDQHMLRMA
jgi:hypothetical protein